MPRTKKGPGRGRAGRPLPPKIDATMEDMAKAMMAMPSDHEWQYEKGEGKIYQCWVCLGLSGDATPGRAMRELPRCPGQLGIRGGG